jgi:hypothetical protein
MDIASLHPIDPETLRQYVGALNGTAPERGRWVTDDLRSQVRRAREGNERAANQVSLGLARALGAAGPVYTYGQYGLSFWEAQVDRPLGMLMRPPSRLFTDAGLDPAASRAMPIRLDIQLGMMGGAWIPDRLIEQAYVLLDDHLERSVKRLVAAEHEPLPALTLMFEAVGYARSHGLGLYEALGVVGPGGTGPAGVEVRQPDPRRLDPALVARIRESQKEPKQPGLIQRLFGRGHAANGRAPGSGE